MKTFTKTVQAESYPWCGEVEYRVISKDNKIEIMSKENFENQYVEVTVENEKMSNTFTPQQYKSFSSNLLKLMNYYKLTQNQIASDLGVSQSTISRWVGGYGLPLPEMINKICVYFNIDTNELFKGVCDLPQVTLQSLLSEVSMEELICAINNKGFSITLHPIKETIE